MKTILYALSVLYVSHVSGNNMEGNIVILKKHLTRDVCLDESRKISINSKKHKVQIYCIPEK